ncbi:MAG: hypothetical protein RI931_815, partial [Actinomycetota bacterium]
MTTLTHLSQAGVSVLIDTTSGTPAVLHWGRALPSNIDVAELVRSQ